MRKFDWVIKENDMFIIVELNGGVHCMLQKHHPGFAIEKQQVLKEIEFSKLSGKVNVEGIELLQS